MKLILTNKKLDINIYTDFFNRFKTFRFKLENIEEGILLPHKRRLNTYLFCQRTDIVLTDDEFKIIKIVKNIKSEKFIFSNKLTYYAFILPQNTAKELNKDDLLKVKLTKEEENLLTTFNNKYMKKYLKKKAKILTKRKKKLEKKKKASSKK